MEIHVAQFSNSNVTYIYRHGNIELLIPLTDTNTSVFVLWISLSTVLVWLCLISVHIAVCAALQNTYKLSFAWFYIDSVLMSGSIHAQANISSGATMIGCYDMIASVM